MKRFFTISTAFLFLQTLRLPAIAQASITCPANKIVATDQNYCTAVVYGIDPVVSPSNATVHYTVISPGSTEFGFGSASGRSFPLGLNTITYTLPDYPGVSCSFTITVEDHTPPVISCPANFTVKCAFDVPVVSVATATDACGGSVSVQLVSQVKSNQTCINRYVLTRTFRATDAAGNSSTCAQLITVNDDEPPYFLQTVTSPLNVSCASEVQPAYSNQFTARDNCEEELDEIPVTFKEVKSDSTCPNKYTLTRTWTATDFCGNTAVQTQIIHVNDQVAPTFNVFPSSLVSVSCSSEVPAANVITATDNCSGGAATVTFKEVKSAVQCENKFTLTRVWTATDACSNTATVSQVITVNDTQAPVFDGYPPASLVNVSCEKDIPVAPPQTATDNCGHATVTLSEVKSNVQCTNRFTLTRTWTATDECGNTAQRTQVIEVNDNIPPTVSSVSADLVVLWPPNHKMVDVTINYTAADNCGATATLGVSSSDPVNGGSDGDQSPDWEIIDAHHVRLRAEKANNGQSRIYTITIHVTDGCNGEVDTAINVIVAHDIKDPVTGNPFKIGSTVSFNGAFWDKPGNTHTAKWLLDGTAATNGSVTEPSGNQNGKVAGSYKFTSAGVYKLQMNVTDQTGVTSYANTNKDLDAIVVIYDPNGGYSYGGGWFSSQAGALTGNPAAEGKASYGYSVNYRNGTRPKGETQFEFKVGTFEFNALNFDYLVINGAKAQFTGSGKIIGGQSGVGFVMTVTDGALDGTDIDRIRMKIFNRNTGYVYYDNQPGASDAADPVTAVGSNSSIVIQGPEQLTTVKNPEPSKENLSGPFELVAYPNPTTKSFNVRIATTDLSTKLQLQVYDQSGRLLERKDNITPNALIMLGQNYQAGIYYLKITQGSQHSEAKLIKL